MTVIRLPIPQPSEGLYRNHWMGELENNPRICGQRARYICTREPGHPGPHDSELCELWINGDPGICGQRAEYICTREPGHPGPHAAHHSAGQYSGLCELWINGDPDLEMDEGL